MDSRILFPVAIAGLIYLAMKSSEAAAAERPKFDPYVEIETSGAGMDDETYRQYLIANGYDPAAYGYDPIYPPFTDPGSTGEGNPIPEYHGGNIIEFPGAGVEYLDDAAGTFQVSPDQQNSGAQMSETENIGAFLRTIRYAEGTAGPDGYRMHFGGTLFDSFHDHPRKVITAKLGGSSISSSAAGAYQILSTTWDDLQKVMQLPDFSPESQDAAAIYLITRRGALADVKAGNFERAIAKLNKEWASLPGSPYGQPTKSMDKLVSFYTGQGGAIAA